METRILKSSKVMWANGSGETQELFAQRSCVCPVTENVQDQPGWGFEQPGVVEYVVAHGRGIELAGL